ncbi:DUF7927 domain-containing protein [Microbacterium tumbae]
MTFIARAIAPSSVHEGKSSRRLAALIATALATTLTIGGTAIAAAPAYAAPVSEITGTWIDPPGELKSGDPVVADWRLNLNDDAQPPANGPVDDVTATFAIENGEFAEIPDICLTDGVDPASAVSDDGLTLTCNLGTVNMGTAVAVQTPVIADGATGSELTLGGAIDGREASLPEIPIVNPFLMDMDITNPTSGTSWNAAHTQPIVDFPWTLYVGRNSDQGPANITIPLRLTASNGNPVLVGNDQRDGLGSGCVPRHTGNAGHPVSEGSTLNEDRIAPFVETCQLVVVNASTGRYDLVLTGIDYSGTIRPTKDSAGRLLPADRTAVATGTTWFRVNAGDTNGSIQAQIVGQPTYTAPTGQTSTDDPANNQASRSWVLSGAWNGRWTPGYTGGPGESFADNYRVAAGTQVQQSVQNNMGTGDLGTFPDSALYGDCIAFDSRWVSYESATVGAFAQNPSAAPQIEYYVGSNARVTDGSGQYDPDLFDCGIADGGWTAQEPDDPATVKAIRVVYPLSTYRLADPRPDGAVPIALTAVTEIHEDAPAGQDIWTFSTAMRNGNWADRADFDVATPTPGARYPGTKNGRDVLRISTVQPAISKDVERTTIVPGVPVGYTLTYSANGTGNVPTEVDAFRVVDTLPAGMTYVAGSADPEPAVSLSGRRQILTWSLDDVTTNEAHELGYQAVGDSTLVPGVQLENTAVASSGDASSPEADATVTTSSNGYTTILKTSDADYIRNDAGDGVGTGSWTVEIESHDSYAQAFTDTIDILPYLGDQRGTSFSGSYTLDEVIAPEGATVYYTDADPATLVDDPADPSNGAAGDPDGNSVGWSTTRPAEPTAVRVIGGPLPPGGSFSFQVVITTDGAQPQDVYVNSAQARAEHTALVMRTSAYLVVTDYTVTKTSDPSGETVVPGQVVQYRVTIVQQGDVPGAAVFTDDLSDVLDDAEYNGDATASIGTVSIADGTLAWEGEIPVGGSAVVTYSVTVKTTDRIEDEGDWNLQNEVVSPGCRTQSDCIPPANPVGDFRFSKTSDPASGSDVVIGDVVEYHVQVTHVGAAAVPRASIEDDLSEVLDDASWNDDATATSGEVAYADGALTWSGELEIGQVVDIVYSVTVTGYGDWLLSNIATDGCTTDEDGCVPPPPGGRCVPAPDENPDCRTEHRIGGYEISKSSDPVTGSDVEIGDVVEYTVTVAHVGEAPVPASFTDDLSDVLDDASWDDDLAASGGEAVFNEPGLSWSGDLEVGDVVTVTYSVTVVAGGDLTLRNVVTPPPDVVCVPAEGQDEACTTEHYKGEFEFSKTSDPEPGSLVSEGDIVTYTVSIAQIGPAAVQRASVVDDISGVLPVASWNDDAEASAGTVERVGDEVRWTGDLAVGQVVTITYSVTVGAKENAEFRNVVATDDPRGTCVDAADGNPDCRTEHHTPGGGLAGTGLELSPWLLAAIVVLLGGGGLLALLGARRRRVPSEENGNIDDLL